MTCYCILTQVKLRLQKGQEEAFIPLQWEEQWLWYQANCDLNPFLLTATGYLHFSSIQEGQHTNETTLILKMLILLPLLGCPKILCICVAVISYCSWILSVTPYTMPMLHLLFFQHQIFFILLFYLL